MAGQDKPRRIPQGILDERLAATKFSLTRHQPAEALREFVEYYWILRWDRTGARPHRQGVLPNLSVHVTFFRGISGVFGPAHHTFFHVLRGREQGLGVRFRPGCFRPLLGRPVRAITDTSRPLAEIFGTQRITTERIVTNAARDEEMVAAANELLATIVPAHLPAASRRAAEIVETIAREPEITRVDQLASATAISLRNLQRLFVAEVGVTPKWAIRVYRINDAARQVGSGEPIDYAALAAELGYSDQAHFSRDFTTMIGTPPTRYPGTR